MIKMLGGETKALSGSEKRELKTWQSYEESHSLTAYFKGISEYVQDHFGFRDELILINSKILLSLSKSPVKKVIKGKQGWLYYRTYDPVARSLANEPIVKRKADLRTHHIRQRATRLSKRGLPYLYAIAPNKMVIYPEFLPHYISSEKNSYVYDLFASLLKASDLDFYVDIKSPLINQRKQETQTKVFFTHDTHWNQFGAYLAFLELTKEIERKFPTVEIARHRFEFTDKEIVGGDLARLLKLGDTLKTIEPTTSFEKCANYKYAQVSKRLRKASCEKNTTVILIIGDSFKTNLAPFFTQTTGSVYLAHEDIGDAELEELLEVVDPDIVIEEMIQRYLLNPVPEH